MEWNGLDLDLIWIEFGLRLEFSKISRNVLARPVMGTIFLVLVDHFIAITCTELWELFCNLTPSLIKTDKLS